jgi:pyridoxine 5-phosphate synthase
MAATDEMVALALELNPDQVTLVPERREEVTTEGGLDVAGNRDRLSSVTRTLTASGIQVSMFIDPDLDQVSASHDVGATAVELHTGRYAEASNPSEVDREYDALVQAAVEGQGRGLVTHLGHGLNYHNTQRVCAIPGIAELNIGHSIISRAVFVGLTTAVREMKQLIEMAQMRPNT